MSQHQSSVPTTLGQRSFQEWLSSLPALLILLAVIFMGSGEILHGQLLKWGEQWWNEYFLLRGDIPAPDCDLNPDIEAEVARLVAEAEAEPLDELDAFFAEPTDPDVIRQSLQQAQSLCQEKYAAYNATLSRVTPAVEVYRTLEVGIAKVVAVMVNYKRLLLCILVLVCAATATAARHHISLRPVHTFKEYYLATAAQLVANLILLFSAWSYRNLEAQSLAEGVTVDYFYLHNIWIAGFALLSFINLVQLIKPAQGLESGGSWGKAILSIPLYTLMCLIAGGNFIAMEHYAGISIYLGQMMELADLFLKLALYIWIGMLLKNTRLAHLVFDAFRPWRMSPELLACVILFITVVPTAYTGASGIFVIAAGAVIYAELIRAGARRQLALAATAMSGSLGVVLRPCLLVVIIAALNKQVTTDQLFDWGFWVFLLTISLFFIVSQISRTEKVAIAPVQEALPQFLANLRPLVPYALIAAAVILFFSWGLSAQLDEFSAPIILPFVLLAILFYEKIVRKDYSDPDDLSADHQPSTEPVTLERALRFATNETTGHIGALLMLMALSVSMGGIIERTHLIEMLPATFDSIWVAMSLLVVTLVIIGMIMDPYGAVILVSATIANIAYNNGIHPVHFWMVTLVAFELGYLSPPVALNHLLTRQVVGEQEVALARLDSGSFWSRYERYLLPIVVMGTALLLVAYIPLIIGYNS